MRTAGNISAKSVYFYYGLIPNVCTSNFSNVPKGNVSKHVLLTPYKNQVNHTFDSWNVIWCIFTASGCNLKPKNGTFNAYFQKFPKLTIWQKWHNSRTTQPILMIFLPEFLTFHLTRGQYSDKMLCGSLKYKF